jgi:membrane protein DedA with SNARE-associated domain/rhodanese-related sulfurtransferase
MPIAIEFFVQYAYVILFTWVLLEQLGIPIPTTPALLTVGTLSAAHKLHASIALAAVVIACLLADSVWWWLGRRFGGRVVKLVCRLSLEASACVKKTEGYFGRRGGVTLLFAKFVPGLNTLAPPVAGQTGMSYPKFLAMDGLGALIWGSAYIFAGRFFGDIAKKNAAFFHWMGRFAGVLFLLLVIGFLVQKVWRQRKFLLSVRELRLDASELKKMIDTASEDGTVAPFIVDLRHPLDYLPDPRVLPGAVRIQPAELEKQHDQIPRDRDVVLYCTCPSEETSAKVALRLHKLGIYRVRPLKGGFDGWKQAGYPLEEYVEPASTGSKLAVSA